MRTHVRLVRAGDRSERAVLDLGHVGEDDHTLGGGAEEAYTKMPGNDLGDSTPAVASAWKGACGVHGQEQVVVGAFCSRCDVVRCSNGQLGVRCCRTVCVVVIVEVDVLVLWEPAVVQPAPGRVWSLGQDMSQPESGHLDPAVPMEDSVGRVAGVGVRACARVSASGWIVVPCAAAVALCSTVVLHGL